MKKYLLSTLPQSSEEQIHQTELQELPEAEFFNLIKKQSYTFLQRLYQLICFFLFLGPIRFVVGITFSFFGFFFITILRVLFQFMGFPPDYGQSFCYLILRFSIRILLFSFGIVWIQNKGTIDNSENVRFIISNHISFLDIFIIAYIRAISPVIKIDTEHLKFLNPILDTTNSILTSHSRSDGIKKKIIDHADDFKRYPVFIFPEDTTTNGNALLRFRSNAFSTPYKVQPMAIRYLMFLVPHGWNTYCWNYYTNFFDYIYCMLSIPFSIVTVDSLESLSMDKDGKSEISRFTTVAQKVLANHLKIQAVSNSIKDIDEESLRKLKQE